MCHYSNLHEMVAIASHSGASRREAGKCGIDETYAAVVCTLQKQSEAQEMGSIEIAVAKDLKLLPYECNRSCLLKG
eukprot:IDg13435t1